MKSKQCVLRLVASDSSLEYLKRVAAKVVACFEQNLFKPEDFVGDVYKTKLAIVTLQKLKKFLEKNNLMEAYKQVIIEEEVV